MKDSDKVIFVGLVSYVGLNVYIIVHMYLYIDTCIICILCISHCLIFIDYCIIFRDNERDSYFSKRYISYFQRMAHN